nr:hypothetical protein JUJ52_09920 [Virgibacillus sp. AGTR]
MGKNKTPHGWKFHFIPHITGSKIRTLSNKVNPIWVSVEQLPVNVRSVHLTIRGEKQNPPRMEVSLYI